VIAQPQGEFDALINEALSVALDAEWALMDDTYPDEPLRSSGEAIL
jgi:hypothetical protein